MQYEAKQAARATAAEALIASFPKLIPVAGGKALTTAAKNIRIELKAAFPGVKFSVRTESFSMGDAIRVSWTDGPTTAMVDAIVDKYQAGSFNGMEDIYEYSRSAWTDAFGDAKYVSTSRERSDKATASALRTLAAKNIEELEGVDLSLEAYKAGKLSSVRVWGDWVTTLVYQIAAKRTWSVPKSEALIVSEVAAA